MSQYPWSEFSFVAAKDFASPCVRLSNHLEVRHQLEEVRHQLEIVPLIQTLGLTIVVSLHDLNMAIDVNLTEMILVLGPANRMVGYTGISGWRTLDEDMREGVEKLPELASKYPSKEVLIGADADFFFAGWNYGMKVGGEVTPETLAPFGIQVYELTESCIHIGEKAPASMEDMHNDLRNLGAIF